MLRKGEMNAYDMPKMIDRMIQIIRMEKETLERFKEQF